MLHPQGELRTRACEVDGTLQIDLQLGDYVTELDYLECTYDVGG